MTKEKFYTHAVYFDTKEEKVIFQNWLGHLKYKTGQNYGTIVNKAMEQYNEGLDGKL